MISEISDQKDTCDRFGAAYQPPKPDEIVGVSKNLASGTMPINGLRHPPVDGTCGWYIWAGEMDDRDDFFHPVHVHHLKEMCPQILKYLALAPGWRFQCDDRSYEDVWHDESLLSAE